MENAILILTGAKNQDSLEGCAKSAPFWIITVRAHLSLDQKLAKEIVVAS